MERAMLSHEWFSAIYGDAESGQLVLWNLLTKQHLRFHVSELGTPEFGDRIAAVVESARKSPGSELYYGVCLQSPGEGRGQSSTACVLPAIWADIDFAGKSSTTKRYPPADAASRLFLSLPLKPSTLVVTGGGVHAYWALHEPIEIDPSNREHLASIVRGWQSILRQRLADAGKWEMDSTHDLARVLRVPGSFSHRHGIDVQVDVSCDDPSLWPRYSIDDFETYVSSFTQFAAALQHEVRVTDTPDGVALPAKFNVMLENVPELRLIWNHAKRFASCSEYELSLANYCVDAGMSDNDIASVIVAHRYRYQPEKLEKATRKDYLERTIAKAKASRSHLAALDALGIGLTEDVAPVESRAKRAPEGDETEVPAGRSEPEFQERQKTLAAISAALGVHVVRITKTGREDSIITAWLSTGASVRLGSTKQLVGGPSTARVAILEATHLLVPGIRQKDWESVVRAIFSVAEVDKWDSEETSRGAQLTQLIARYLGGAKARGLFDREVAAEASAPFVDGWPGQSARLYLSAVKLHEWLTQVSHRPPSIQDLFATLGELGFDRQQVRVGSKRIRYYCLQVDTMEPVVSRIKELYDAKGRS